MRAVQVFGFHLATVDLRQSSDKHEAVLAELLEVARIEADYARSTKTPRRALLLRAAQRRAAAARARRRVLGAGARRAGDLRDRASRCASATAREALRHYIICTPRTVSDLLEVLLLQKECGLLRGTLDDDARTTT